MQKKLASSLIAVLALSCARPPLVPRVDEALPVLTGFAPQAGEEGTTVIITGAHLSGATAVSFGRVPAASFTVVNETTIAAIVANGATGHVKVTTVTGSDSLATFTFTGPPLTQRGLVIHHPNTQQASGQALTIDQQDQIISFGSFQGGINGRPFTAAGLSDALLAKYTPTGGIRWERTAGGANAQVLPQAVETDAAGRIYTAGSFGQESGPARSIGFGNNVTITSRGGLDGFLAKYDALGAVQWALSLGNGSGNTEERIWDIAVDADGNSYVCGVFTGSMNMNPRGTTPRLLSGGGQGHGIFLAKYDPNGMNLWATSVSANLGSFIAEAYTSVTIDHLGNVLLGGHYRNVVALGSGVYPSAGNADLFVASYRQSDAVFNWARVFGGAGNDQMSPGGLRVNAQAEPHFTGRLSGTMSIGGTTLSSSPGALSNLYVVALNPDGSNKFSFAVPSASGESGGSRVHFDNQNFLYVAGWYSGNATYQNIPIQSKSGNGSGDAALARFSPSGQLIWFQSFGSQGFTGPASRVNGLATDQQGNVLVNGRFFGINVNWDPQPGAQLQTSSAGMDDAFLAKYRSNGSLWQRP